MHEKKTLRRHMLKARGAIDPTAKAHYDAAICARLMEVVGQRRPKIVHAYLPMGSEIDIFPVIAQLLSSGIVVVTPKTLPKRTLHNLVLRAIDEVEEGRFGTTHPASGIEYNGPFDLYIMPGLAFDHHNMRLGYGAGYYDTFLQQQQGGYKLAICYPFQIVDTVPTEPHDVVLDEVLWLPGIL